MPRGAMVVENIWLVVVQIVGSIEMVSAGVGSCVGS